MVQGDWGVQLPRGARSGRFESGFSLIELIVTIVVLAILVTLATPSFTSLLNSSRLTAQANELVASLQLARSEAVRRNTPVTLCRSTNGSTCAGAGAWERWIAVVSATGGAAAEVVRDTSVRQPLNVTAGVDSVVFRPDGLARNGAGGLLSTSLNVCLDTSKPPENQRVVELASGSRISIAKASGDCP
ncbi:GspH/FimT family pseudopilin [Lysobacter sp. H23M47]|nr:GspH/FimT family pseudopilin [Lysobacter sp. H23M47]